MRARSEREQALDARFADVGLTVGHHQELAPVHRMPRMPRGELVLPELDALPEVGAPVVAEPLDHPVQFHARSVR